ncbi:kinase-like domain-containing protein [Xylaria arbuscula]|nr:kinase-like domain-containing protein [Xylaria arbuscula]
MDSPEDESHSPAVPEPVMHARVEDIRGYIAGGFHPVHLGDRIGSEERFEVHHKLGFSDTCIVWLCLDRKNKRRVAVKILRAENSTESHPEVSARCLFEGIDRDELRSNHIFTVEEHFWIDGPNGRHICLVTAVLGPPISCELRGIDLDTPDLLTDLCFQAAQSLRYLHAKGICHGDFRPDHMRLQLDVEAMSKIAIYELFGEPRVLQLDGSQEEDKGKPRPRYLVEPANIADLEWKYRTGQIAIDNFCSSHREGDETKPHIFDIHYPAPEIRFLNKSSGFCSDIWSLASTIHLVRTTKLLLARLNSRASLVSWLAWTYGPFPQEQWNAIGEFLSSDSAIPLFTVNLIPQKIPDAYVARPTESGELEDTTLSGYPLEWALNRDVVVGVLLGKEETPYSIEERKLLQVDKDRSKFLRIKLPKNLDVWTKFQGQRKQLTECQSLLHEDLSKERQWYEDTDALGEKTAQEVSSSSHERIDSDTLRRLNSTWDLADASELATDKVSRNQEGEIDVPSVSENTNGKRPLTGEDREARPGQKSKKIKGFVAEHNLRDRVERVEQSDGMTKFSYRLQHDEVKLLASLLRDMLKNNPGERIAIGDVVLHPWFDGSRARFGKT